MTRRGSGQSGATVTLFPFLAVLLCTMGALIVVLVVIARRAQQEVTEASATVNADIATAVEDLNWRRSVLEDSHAATVTAFERARNELSYLEQRVRETRQELQARQAAIEELQRNQGLGTQDRETLAAELERLRGEVQLGRRRLEEAKREATSRPKSFAIIPYHGAHGTRRRPVYLECRGDSIVLQPEGLVLEADDFVSLGPSNPLAAAVRATREYVVTQQGTHGDPGYDPYPLLLVRPDGIPAFYIARASLESYGTDFGYELIDADWKLTFPPADKRLAEIQRLAAEEARARIRVLAVAAPRLYGRAGRGRSNFEALGLGEEPGEADGEGANHFSGSGRSKVSGAPGGWGLAGQDQAAQPAEAGNQRPKTGDGWSSDRDRDLLARTNLDLIEGPLPPGSTSADGTIATSALPGGGLGSPQARSADGSFLAGGTGVGEPSGGSLPGGPGGGLTQPGGPPAEGLTTGTRRIGSELGANLLTGKPGGNESSAFGANSLPPGAGMRQHSSSGGVAAGNAGTETALSSGNQTMGSAAPGAGGATAASSSTAAGASHGSPGSGADSPAMLGVSGPRSDRFSRNQFDRRMDSFEKTRGENWALPAENRNAVPVARPVRIQCHSDRLVVVPEKHGVEPVVIEVQGATAEAIDRLVGTVWEQVDTWGLAGNGFQWRPELRVEVQPGGEARFADLQALMAGSGLAMTKAEPPRRSAVRNKLRSGAPK